MNSPMKLHIANIDLCDITVDTIESIIHNLLDNLDDVSKYKVISDVTCNLDNLTQTCYDEASAEAQDIIELLEDCGWEYKKFNEYTEYNAFIRTFLNTPESKHTSDAATDMDIKGMRDVKEEFGFGDKLAGQLHFPRDYDNELALATGVTRKQEVQPTTHMDLAEQKRRQRVAFLAQVKAQQNTSQSE